MVLWIKLGLLHNLLSLLIAVSPTGLVKSDFYTFWTPLALAVAVGSPLEGSQNKEGPRFWHQKCDMFTVQEDSQGSSP